MPPPPRRKTSDVWWSSVACDSDPGSPNDHKSAAGRRSEAYRPERGWIGGAGSAEGWTCGGYRSRPSVKPSGKSLSPRHLYHAITERGAIRRRSGSGGDSRLVAIRASGQSRQTSKPSSLAIEKKLPSASTSRAWCAGAGLEKTDCRARCMAARRE